MVHIRGHVLTARTSLIHSLHECQKLKIQQFSKKIEFLRSNGLCFWCLRRGHQKSTCHNKATCSVYEFKHPTLLHINNYKSHRSGNNRYSESTCGETYSVGTG